MANLTLTIDEDVLLRARQRALEGGTSVNALVRSYLESFAGADEALAARRAFAAGAERTPGSSGPGGRDWSRATVHDR